jgi:hypothetical protein
VEAPQEEQDQLLLREVAVAVLVIRELQGQTPLLVVLEGMVGREVAAELVLLTLELRLGLHLEETAEVLIRDLPDLLGE